MMGERAEGRELFECSLDLVAANVAVKETPDLFPGQSIFRLLDGKLDAIGGDVSGGGAEEDRGSGGTVLPYSEGGLEMRHGDDGAAIKGSVDGTETQDLGFGPAGGGSEETRTGLAQVGVTLFPKLFRGLVAAHDDAVVGSADPIESST
jgi:hypothetical protein